MASRLEALARGMRGVFYEAKTGQMDEVAARLESPLEDAVFWALVSYLGIERGDSNSSTGALPGAVDATSPAAVRMCGARKAVIFPQVDVKVASGDVYRLDLALVLVDREKRTASVVAVELDGHDFHERTPEQAERDKRRDRDLQALGWRVARFTGAQAHRDIIALVEELIGFADSVGVSAEG